MIPTSLTIPSFAKINWSLRVLGKRPDGYHELRTILQTISLHDDLHFKLRDDGSLTLTCNEPSLPTDETNLVIRAAQALRQHFELKAGADISLQKRIPSKAGLGGGSSNAAVSLLALSCLWKLEATSAQLLDIAASLGADVPFFLTGGTVAASGTGTALSPLSDRPLAWLIIVAPNADVSTAQAYAALNSPALTTLDLDPILSSSPTAGVFNNSPDDDLDAAFVNDFESVIFDREPEIRRAKEALLQAGASKALLAGSGSSVFGVFASEDAQRSALKAISLEPGWRTFACVTLSRNEYNRALNAGGISLARSFNFDSDLGA